jgi:hypothetical protein
VGTCAPEVEFAEGDSAGDFEAAEEESEAEDGESSARATHGVNETAPPMPRATAKAPTRPTFLIDARSIAGNMVACTPIPSSGVKAIPQTGVRVYLRSIPVGAWGAFSKKTGDHYVVLPRRFSRLVLLSRCPGGAEALSCYL